MESSEIYFKGVLYMKTRYTQPELELRRMRSLEAIAADDAMSADDNELDIGDTGWGDF